MNPIFEDFKVVRKVRALNLSLQIILGLLLFFALNFMAARHYLQYDFSENRKNSLSPESVAFISTLSHPIEIYCTITQKVGDSSSMQIYKQVSYLLRRYEYAASKNADAKIKLSFIDPHFDSKVAANLAAKFGKDMENSIVISCQERTKKLSLSDLYLQDADNNRVFRGEQSITSAIVNVSSETLKKVYFLKGHGEMSYTSSDLSRGLSEFANYLSAQNYSLAELDLVLSKQVPSDAGLVIIASPQASFLPREIDALRKYLINSNGKIAVFLDMGSLHGLEEIFYEWGILADNMLVLDNSGDYETSDGDLIARHFPSNAHPIVRYLLDSQLPVQFGSVRPVREDLGAPLDENLKITPIILSGKSSWAERSYLINQKQQFDADVDLKGPIPLASVASRSGGKELGLTIPGGRLAVFGDDNFIANKYFNRLGNSKLALNTANWMFDDNTMLGIPPRQVEKFSLTLSSNDIISLGLKFLILPAFVFVLGTIVYFVRR